MNKRVEVRNQAEFDACEAEGNIAVVVEGHVELHGNSSGEFWGNSRGVFHDASSGVFRDASSGEFYGNSSGVFWGNSRGEFWGNSRGEFYGNSSGVFWDDSSGEFYGNSSGVFRDDSSGEFWDSSRGEAFGNAFLRIFSAGSIRASDFVTIVKHGEARELLGGRVLDAAPEPRRGAEFCAFHGLDPASAPYRVADLDRKMLELIERDRSKFDMLDFHGERNCDETNWCQTTHCRAGFAICLAGKPGFELERQYGPEMAGRMIYAVSRPEAKLPDFFTDDETALADIRRSAEASDAT